MRDKLLYLAVDAFEWAGRWFFHMWITASHPDSRWPSYAEWKQGLRSLRQRPGGRNRKDRESFAIDVFVNPSGDELTIRVKAPTDIGDKDYLRNCSLALRYLRDIWFTVRGK